MSSPTQNILTATNTLLDGGITYATSLVDNFNAVFRLPNGSEICSEMLKANEELSKAFDKIHEVNKAIANAELEFHLAL